MMSSCIITWIIIYMSWCSSCWWWWGISFWVKSFKLPDNFYKLILYKLTPHFLLHFMLIWNKQIRHPKKCNGNNNKNLKNVFPYMIIMHVVEVCTVGISMKNNFFTSLLSHHWAATFIRKQTHRFNLIHERFSRSWCCSIVCGRLFKIHRFVKLFFFSL